MNFQRTHHYLLDIQNELNAFVLDLTRLKQLRAIQDLLYFDGQTELKTLNKSIDHYIDTQSSTELKKLEDELSRVINLYELRNKQLWMIDREFVYEEIGEVLQHCLSVRFSRSNCVLSTELHSKLAVTNSERQQNIFGHSFQFDIRDISEQTMIAEMSGFEIEIIELNNATEKTLLKQALHSLYQNDIYQVGDGVLIQTSQESYFIHAQSDRNHYLKIKNGQPLICKTCIGPPKASRCSTATLATQH